jgi:nucleoside-triphosphatase THEP1
MKRIFLLSGPVHSGKTSRLMRWIAGRHGIDGILAPVIDGKRYLQHIGSGELKLLDICGLAESKHIESIATHRFDHEVFVWAQQALVSCMKQPLQWLLIDEIGPLELHGGGLEPAAGHVIKHFLKVADVRILLVVRDSLREAALKHYQIRKKQVAIFTADEESIG